MDTATILIIAVGLAMDAFSVAAVAGFVLKAFSKRHAFRLSFHFGLFQFFMPLLGWMAGLTVADLIANYDHWVAFGLLTIIGCKMIHEGFADKKKPYRIDPTKGISLLVFSIATSIDALAVGLTFAFTKVEVLYPAILIGLVASLFTLLGFYLGSKSSRFFGEYVEVIGGTILIFIGIRILIEHIF